ncbi:MAG: hydroxymethylbilane synthase [Bacteroidota bacterium]|nr:hydroxymethylbilane synthase [Bacteroidota bacterium]
MNFSRPSLIIGSRGSELALWQSNFIKQRLESLYPNLRVDIKIIKTTGDKILDSPLSVIGGKGVFTVELERALLLNEIDIAVHSLKDLPTQLDEGLTIVAIPQRANVEDAFLSNDRNAKLFELPKGATVATGSLRRKAQILARRPDYTIIDIRGNVPTRIRKLRESSWDGMLLASAGLERLGLAGEITHHIPVSDMLPAPGQGALAIEARENDAEIAEVFAPMEDEKARLSSATERHILHALGGGCQLPLGTFVRKDGEDYLIDACIAYPSGKGMLRQRLRSGQEELLQNAEAIAAAFMSQGAGEMIANLTDSETTEKTH